MGISKHSPSHKAKERLRDQLKRLCREDRKEGGAFPCPQDGCVRLFQRLSNLERHLSFEKCTKVLERLSLMDLSKTGYASLLDEGAVAMPTLLPTSTFTAVTPVPQEGWALKETKKAYLFNGKQRSYLEAKFSIGQATGRKFDGEIVAKEMRHALGSDGRRLFKSSEFLTVQQITSYFFRLSAKVRQQVVTTEEDICAVAEEANFHKSREDILLAMNLEHPIVFDQYNICDLVRDNRLKNLKLGLLQMLCEKFNLQGSVTDCRKKASHIDALADLVSGCSCSH